MSYLLKKATNIWRCAWVINTAAVCWLAVSTANAAEMAAAPTLAIADLQAQAIAYATSHYKNNQQGFSRVDIRADRMDSRLALHRCSEPLTMEIPNINARANKLLVKTRCNGDKPWAIFVPLRVDLWKTVVTTTRPLKRGALVGAQDVALKETMLANINGHYLTSTEQAIDKVTTQNISSGAAVSARQLSAPKLVKRGDEVTIVSQSGTVTVRMTGKALADGKMHDQISVRNLRSDRVIKARVVDRGKVRIDS